ncbi:MAG: protein-L-isoaspartate(D-aspartate) O-methyltransferase [Candidatus Aenigmarchaeota archaeon]|nr:protein-L-isoaspartate(D-aspartate) O-methyltransferase [Candidatus Aenigmarchaeota archaeon]
MDKDQLIQGWIKRKIITDKKIISAFQELNRENFILEEYKDQAYADYPLPILAGQTISQPTTIAIMTSLLEPKEKNKILEIGTGSGYQAAILGKIVGSGGKIISIEIIEELAEFAKANLKKENITNVEIIHGDGSVGYEKQSPYDRIIITAATPKITDELIGQLKDYGLLVAPVGYDIHSLVMTKIIKQKNTITKHEFGSFSFVPLRGIKGFE